MILWGWGKRVVGGIILFLRAAPVITNKNP